MSNNVEWSSGSVEIRKDRDQWGSTIWRLWVGGGKTHRYGMSLEGAVRVAHKHFGHELNGTSPTSPATSSQPKRDITRHKCLFIANADYQLDEDRLANPIRDATMLAKTMRERGHDVTEEFFVANATLSEMQEVLSEFHEILEPQDHAFVYYAGHGLEIKGKAFLLPVDCTVTKPFQIASRAIEMEMVVGSTENCTGRVVVFDACRGNSVARRFRSPGVGFGAGSTPRGKGNSYIWFSTGPGSSASDGPSGDHGPFALALDSALQSNIRLADLAIQVSNSVLEATNHNQEPWAHQSLRSALYI